MPVASPARGHDPFNGQCVVTGFSLGTGTSIRCACATHEFTSAALAQAWTQYARPTDVLLKELDRRNGYAIGNTATTDSRQQLWNWALNDFLYYSVVNTDFDYCLRAYNNLASCLFTLNRRERFPTCEGRFRDGYPAYSWTSDVEEDANV